MCFLFVKDVVLSVSLCVCMFVVVFFFFFVCVCVCVCVFVCEIVCLLVNIKNSFVFLGKASYGISNLNLGHFEEKNANPQIRVV